MKPSRILANLVGMMLFVQVILGGGAVFGFVDVAYHLAWGVITFGVLIVATVFGAREYGSRSALVKTGVAAIVDYVIQIGLGVSALVSSSGAIIVVHLTNAFVLAVIATYMISFADSADKATLAVPAVTKKV